MISDSEKIYTYNANTNTYINNSYLFKTASFAFFEDRLFSQHELFPGGSNFLYSETLKGDPPLLMHARIPSFTNSVKIGYQTLDSDFFKVPYAVYLAAKKHNAQANSLYVFIPELNSDGLLSFDGVFFPVHTFSNSAAITNFLEVPIAGHQESPILNPNPVEDGKTTINGQITAYNSDGEPTDANGVAVYYEKVSDEDNETPNSLDNSDRELTNLVTSTDKNGNFEFENVSAGKYMLTFKRNDLNFSTRTLLYDSTQAMPALQASEFDLTDTKCKKKSLIKFMLGIDRAAENLAKFVLNEADKKYASSQNQSLINNAVDGLKLTYSELAGVSHDLPNVVLACQKRSTCTKVSYTAERKNYIKKAKALRKKARALMQAALKGQAKAKVKSKKMAAVNKRAEKLLSKLTKLPKKSFECGTSLEDITE